MPRSAPTSGYAGSITTTAPGPNRMGASTFPDYLLSPLDANDIFQTDVDYMDMLESAADDDFRFYNTPGPDPFAGISAEGGFDQAEVDAVTALINSNAVTIGQVADQFKLPVNVIQAAYDANNPLGGTQGAYNAILEASAITDTTNEFLEDIANKQKEVTSISQETYNTPKTDPIYQTQIDAKFDALSTAKQELDILTSEGLKSGLIDQNDLNAAFGPSLTEQILSGVGDVLGTGTKVLRDVASNVPVVGPYLGDAVEGTADWLKNTAGTLTVNPITGTVQGFFGDIPPWMETQTVTQIGQIPGSQTTAGVSTGTLLDDIISVARGEQDVTDVFKDRGGAIGAVAGIDPKIIAAAAAAGKTIKEYLEDLGDTETTLTTTDGTVEEDPTKKKGGVDLSGGDEEEGPDAVDTLTEGGDEWQNDGAGTVEEVISGRIIGDGLDAGTGPDEVVDPEPPELPPLPPELPEPPSGEEPPPEEEPPLPPKKEPPSGEEPPPEEEPPLPPKKEPPSGEEPPPEEEPEEEPKEEPVTPELPDFGGQGFMGVQTKPGEKVDLGPLYDISASSIFQEPRGEDEQDTLSYLYPNLGGSDIVQDYDIEELIRFLENQRG